MCINIYYVQEIEIENVEKRSCESRKREKNMMNQEVDWIELLVLLFDRIAMNDLKC